MDDHELNQLLREWKAPDAPMHLSAPQRRAFNWRWLLTGSIRVPVPVGLAAALLAAFWLYWSAPDRQPVADTQEPSSQPVVSLADFKPVEEVELRGAGGCNDPRGALAADCISQRPRRMLRGSPAHRRAIDVSLDLHNRMIITGSQSRRHLTPGRQRYTVRVAPTLVSS